MATVFRSAGRFSSWRQDQGNVAVTAQSGVWQNLLTTLLVIVPAPFAQADWPNPRAVPSPVAWSAQPGSVFPSSVVNPFAPANWPNPRGPVFAVQVAVAPNLATTTLAPTAAPATGLDWLNPLRTYAQQVRLETPNLLLTTLAPATVPVGQSSLYQPRALPLQVAWLAQPGSGFPSSVVNPFAPLDWPNPRGSAPVLQAAPIPNLTATTLGLVTAAPFAPLDWPNPTVLRQRLTEGSAGYQPPTNFTARPPLVVPSRFSERVGVAVTATASGTNPLLFGAAAAPPIIPVEWATPRGPYTQYLRLEAPDLLLTTLALPLAPVGAAYQDNPPRATTARQIEQSLDLLLGTLRSQDTFPPGLAGAGPDYDWPNPLRPWQGAGYTAQTTGGLPPAGPTPLAPFDWPNPSRAAGRLGSAQFDPPNALANGLAGQDKLPAALHDWPNPLLPWQRAALYAQVIGAIPPTAPAPLLPFDWPNPPRAAGRIGAAQFDPPDLLLTTLRGQDVLPAGAPDYDWPNPVVIAPRAALLAQSLGYLPTVPAAPFALYSWPNPILAIFRAASQPVGLTPPVAPPPFVLADWPNPLRLLIRAPQFDPPDLLLGTLRGQDALPAGAPDYDWPNPTRVSARWFFDPPNALVYLVPPVPIAPLDWPNPRGVTWRQNWQDPLNYLPIRVPPGTPFAQTYWPNPDGYRQLAFTWFQHPTPFVPITPLLGEVDVEDHALYAVKVWIVST